MAAQNQHEKFFNLQKEMRQNNQEFSDFMADLDGWTQEVNAKERAKSTDKDQKSDVIPPIRNAHLKQQSATSIKTKKQKKEESHSSKQAQQRIQSYDYRAWDKFDVDKALQEIDQSQSDAEAEKQFEKQKSNKIDKIGEAELQDEPDETGGVEEQDADLEDAEEAQRRANLMAENREHGNSLFRLGRFEESIESYTRGLQLAAYSCGDANDERVDDATVLLLTNRAAALLKCDKFAAAEADCCEALSAQPDNSKALYRRALARKSLNRVAEALSDLQHLLRVDPANHQAYSLSRQVQILVDQSEDAYWRVTNWKRTADVASSNRMEAPLRRVPIRDVALSEQECCFEGNKSTTNQSHGTEQQPIKFESPQNQHHSRRVLVEDKDDATSTLEHRESENGFSSSTVTSPISASITQSSSSTTSTIANQTVHQSDKKCEKTADCSEVVQPIKSERNLPSNVTQPRPKTVTQFRGKLDQLAAFLSAQTTANIERRARFCGEFLLETFFENGDDCKFLQSDWQLEPDQLGLVLLGLAGLIVQSSSVACSASGDNGENGNGVQVGVAQSSLLRVMQRVSEMERFSINWQFMDEPLRNHIKSMMQHHAVEAKFDWLSR